MLAGVRGGLGVVWVRTLENPSDGGALCARGGGYRRDSSMVKVTPRPGQSPGPECRRGRFGSHYGSCGSAGSTPARAWPWRRGAADLGHHRDADLAGGEASEPHRNVAGRLGADASASARSHAETGAGSSSTTLYTPGLPCSIAAIVAAAASSTCTNDHTPPPSPMIGSLRLRTWLTMSPSRAKPVPGP